MITLRVIQDEQQAELTTTTSISTETDDDDDTKPVMLATDESSNYSKPAPVEKEM
jgi:hypothetical protein